MSSRRRPYRVRLAADQRTHAYSTRHRAVAAAQTDCLDHPWDARDRVVIHHPTYGGAALATALVRPSIEDGVLVAAVKQLRQRQEVGA